MYYKDGESNRFLVDGQQRFTTLHLIFIASRRLLRDQGAAQEAEMLNRAIMTFDNRGQRRYRIAIEERVPALNAFYQGRSSACRMAFVVVGMDGAFLGHARAPGLMPGRPTCKSGCPAPMGLELRELTSGSSLRRSPQPGHGARWSRRAWVQGRCGRAATVVRQSTWCTQSRNCPGLVGGAVAVKDLYLGAWGGGPVGVVEAPA